MVHVQQGTLHNKKISIEKIDKLFIQDLFLLLAQIFCVNRNFSGLFGKGQTKNTCIIQAFMTNPLFEKKPQNKTKLDIKRTNFRVY